MYGATSLDEVACAQALGATLDTTSSGFHARNSQIARCDFMIAFTWGDSSSEPKKGGTYDTWKMSKCKNKVHIPLQRLSTVKLRPLLVEHNASKVSDFFVSNKKRTNCGDSSESQSKMVKTTSENIEIS
jgi:hypothetical protein